MDKTLNEMITKRRRTQLFENGASTKWRSLQPSYSNQNILFIFALLIKTRINVQHSLQKNDKYI